MTSTSPGLNHSSLRTAFSRRSTQHSIATRFWSRGHHLSNCIKPTTQASAAEVQEANNNKLCRGINTGIPYILSTS
jgi:hypothetical protein